MLNKPLCSRGFTLIEIMIVLVIIGITVVFATVSFQQFHDKRRVLIAAQQFTNDVRFAQRMAIVNGNLLGVDIYPNHYRIVHFSSHKKWLLWHFKKRKALFHLPTGVLTDATHRTQLPTIIINTSGEMTHFVIWFGTEKDPHHVRVTEKDNRIILTRL